LFKFEECIIDGVNYFVKVTNTSRSLKSILDLIPIKDVFEVLNF